MFLFFSSLNLFWPPPFSVSLSLSLSCSCLSFFLLVFFFAFFLFLVFVSFFIFLSSLLLFHEKNNMKILNCNFFFPSIISLFLVSCLVFSLKSLFLSLFFLILSYVFCSTSLFLGFKKPKLKNTNFWSKGGLQQNVIFYEPVFCKMWKVIVFGGAFFANFWLFFKEHYTNRHFSTFSKANTYQKKDIFGSYYLVQVGSYYLVQVGRV